MGNFDKVVVLLVLFLVAIVLGVSLSGPDGNGDEPDVAGDGSGTVLAGGPLESLRGQIPETGARATGAGSPEGDALLHVGIESPGAPPAGRPETGENAPGQPRSGSVTPGPVLPGEGPSATSGAPRILRTEVELETTGSDEYRLYVWSGGDTWSSVATRYYGASRYATLLRTHNEGRQPRAGERILVPVRDFTSEAGSREPTRVVDRGVPAPGWAPRTGDRNSVTGDRNSAEGGDGSRVELPTAIVDGPEEEETPSPPAAAAGAGWYVVQEGQTLSHVSLAVYGSAVHWKRIYEANADVLPDENTVSSGQRLRIPPLEGDVTPAPKKSGVVH